MAHAGLPAVLGTVTMVNERIGAKGAVIDTEMRGGSLRSGPEASESEESKEATFLEDAFVDALRGQDPGNLTRSQLTMIEQAGQREMRRRRAAERKNSRSSKKNSAASKLPPSSSEKTSAHLVDHAHLFEQDVQAWLDGVRTTSPAPTPARPDPEAAELSTVPRIPLPSSPTRQGRKSPRKAIVKPRAPAHDDAHVSSARIESEEAASSDRKRPAALGLDCEAALEQTALEKRLESLKYAGPKRSVFFEIMQSPRLQDLSDQANQHVASQIEIIQSVQRAGLYPEPVAVFKDEEARQEGRLDLSHRGLGDEKLVAATKVAVCGFNLEYLDLSENRLSDRGGAAVFECLLSEDVNYSGVSKPLSLVLSRNALGMRSCEALATVLQQSTHFLCELDISRNKLDSRCADALSGALAEDSVLKSLDVSYNAIGVAGAARLADALLKNKTLRVLCMAWTQINGRGALSILKALQKNTRLDLKSLDLSRNAIGRAVTGTVASLPPAVAGDVVGTLCKLLDTGFLAQKEASRPQAALRPSPSATKLRRKGTEAGGARKGARRVDQEQQGGLIHLNLAHNLLSEAACQRIGDSLREDRCLVGLHLDGNAGHVDPLGGVHVIPQRQSGPRSESILTEGPLLSEKDPSEDFQALIRQTQNLSMETRFEMVAEAWDPRATCWLCAGYLPKRFAVCAKKGARVQLHTSFDYPPWSGCPMTEFKIAQSCTPGVDGGKPDAALESKVGRIASAAMRLAENLFDMAEFAVNRICPPGEIAFFFTVDGVPVVSDLDQQVSWGKVSVRGRVPAPGLGMGVGSDEEIVNIVAIEARQTLSQKSLGAGPGVLVSEASFHLAHSPSTWSLRRETEGMLSYADLAQAADNRHRQQESARETHDPFHIYLPGALREFWVRCPPRSLALQNVPNFEEARGRSRDKESGPMAGLPSPTDESWIGDRVAAHFRAQFNVESRLALFQSDWTASEICLFISSRVEQERTRLLLEENFEDICGVFAVYASQDCASFEPRSGMLLSLDGVVDLYEHISEEGGADGGQPLCSIDQVEDIFQLVLGEQQKRFQAQCRKLKITMARQSTVDAMSAADRPENAHLGWGLTRARFMSLLVKVALASFEKSEPRESEALATLLTRFVLARAQRFDRESYIKTRLRDLSVHAVFRRNIPTLLRLYSSNAGQHQAGFEMAWMSVGEWLRCLKQAGLLAAASAAAKVFQRRAMRKHASHGAVASSEPVDCKSLGKSPSRRGRSSLSNPASLDAAGSGCELEKSAAIMLFSICVPAASQDEPSHDRYYKMDFLSYLLAMSSIVALTVDRNSFYDFMATGRPSDAVDQSRRATLRHTSVTPSSSAAKRSSTVSLLRRMSKVI